MKHFLSEVDSKHTALFGRSKIFAAEAAAPLSTALSQLKLYTAQSISAENKKREVARENLLSFEKSVVAPQITELAALVTASPGWAGRVDPPLAVGSIKYTAARNAFEAVLADAAAAVAPREVVCEAEVPLSALVRGAKSVDLGTVELCGVRFGFRMRRGCNCVAGANDDACRSDGVIEGIDMQNPCACGIVCEATADPVWTALGALYEACGARARAVDDIVFTNDDDDDDDDDDNASDGDISCCRLNDDAFVSKIAAVNDRSKKSGFNISTASSLAKNGDDTVEAPKQKIAQEHQECHSIGSPTTTSVHNAASAAAVTTRPLVANTFGRVNITFAVQLTRDSRSKSDQEIVAACELLLTADNKTRSQSNAVHADNSISRSAASAVRMSLPESLITTRTSSPSNNCSNAMSAVCVRCTVSFPDVVQQARALQLCVDAVAAERREYADVNMQRVVDLLKNSKMSDAGKAEILDIFTKALGVKLQAQDNHGHGQDDDTDSEGRKCDDHGHCYQPQAFSPQHSHQHPGAHHGAVHPSIPQQHRSDPSDSFGPLDAPAVPARPKYTGAGAASSGDRDYAPADPRLSAKSAPLDPLLSAPAPLNPRLDRGPAYQQQQQ